MGVNMYKIGKGRLTTLWNDLESWRTSAIRWIWSGRKCESGVGSDGSSGGGWVLRMMVSGLGVGMWE
jgi:hypothetical protein